MVEFNDHWLGVLGGSWWAPPHVKEQTWRSIDASALDADRRALDLFRAGFDDWYVKDPRISLLLPLWDRLTLRRLPVVVGLRPPRDVAMSLHMRNGTALRRGLAVWLAYNRALFRHTSGRPYLVMDLASTMADPVAAAGALIAFLDDAGLPANGSPTAIAGSVESGLVRQDHQRLEGSAERLAQDLSSTYRELSAMHGVPNSDEPHDLPLPDWAGEALDELSEFWDMQVRAEILQSEVDQLRNRRGWRRYSQGGDSMSSLHPLHYQRSPHGGGPSTVPPTRTASH